MLWLRLTLLTFISSFCFECVLRFRLFCSFTFLSPVTRMVWFRSHLAQMFWLWSHVTRMVWLKSRVTRMVLLFHFVVNCVFLLASTLISISCYEDGLILTIASFDGVFMDLFYSFSRSLLVRLVRIGSCWVYLYGVRTISIAFFLSTLIEWFI